MENRLNLVDGTCLECESVFKHRPDRKGDYCSRSCQIRARNRAQAVHVICSECGISFIPRKNQKSTTCSQNCRRKERDSGRRENKHDGPKGYIMKFVSARGKYIYEHILVMEERLGRRLLKGENVHHMNGLRWDNRDDNLELWNVKQPPGQRVEDLVSWVVDQYPDLVKQRLVA